MTSKDLKTWREKNGYSQGDLAKALGVHIMTVSKWEREERKIPPFLYLALKYLELKGGEQKTKGKRMRKEKGE